MWSCRGCNRPTSFSLLFLPLPSRSALMWVVGVLHWSAFTGLVRGSWWQASARGGLVACDLAAAGRVQLSGPAVTTMEGTLRF